MEIDKPETWDSTYEAAQFSIRKDPREPEAYCVVAREREIYLFLPRGCQRDIALAEDSQGINMLRQLAPYDFHVLRESGVKSASIIRGIRESHCREESARRKFVGTVSRQFR
ncbi:MAG: hypothetical protein Q8P81_01335 [Nanoarchaeota archaeon]|nr:hypothetical protein [Nanoarchaeota archaeon]